MKNEKKTNLRKLNKVVGNVVTACMTEMVEGFGVVSENGKNRTLSMRGGWYPAL